MNAATLRLGIQSHTTSLRVQTLQSNTATSSHPVPVGRTRITVTVTSDSDSPETQDYRIDVTRPADTTLASLGVTP